MQCSMSSICWSRGGKPSRSPRKHHGEEKRKGLSWARGGGAAKTVRILAHKTFQKVHSTTVLQNGDEKMAPCSSFKLVIYTPSFKETDLHSLIFRSLYRLITELFYLVSSHTIFYLFNNTALFLYSHLAFDKKVLSFFSEAATAPFQPMVS